MKHTLRTILYLGFLSSIFTPISLMATSLRVHVTSAHEQFVRNENLIITLSIENLGESAFIIDDYGDYQKNKIEVFLKHPKNGYLPIKEGEPFENVMVMPKSEQTFKIDLQRWFSNMKEGSYFLQILVHKDKEVTLSNIIKFEIVSGIIIGSTTRPVSGKDTIARTYTFLYWPREQVEVLFLRVTETPDNKVIGMVQLGNVLRYEPPKIEFANNGILIVTHQMTRDILIRTTISSTLSVFDVLKRERLLNK